MSKNVYFFSSKNTRLCLKISVESTLFHVEIQQNCEANSKYNGTLSQLERKSAFYVSHTNTIDTELNMFPIPSRPRRAVAVVFEYIVEYESLL